MFGEDDLLLYVGVSKDFGRRWKEHAKRQHWWGDKRFPMRRSSAAFAISRRRLIARDRLGNQPVKDPVMHGGLIPGVLVILCRPRLDCQVVV